MKDIFRGEFVRITAEEPEALAKVEVRWQADSEFHRLAGAEPAMMESEKKLKERFEKQNEDGFNPRRYPFFIRTLNDDKNIGFFGLSVNPIHGEAWFWIAIGEREYWGKGYGTDVINLCLRYAFIELNVHRVSLGVHEYNPRALRAYEKAGFQLEGRTRKDVFREGRHTDSLWMGILRDEWLAMQDGENQ